ncbi:MAG: LamG-like jellyroll fold domain-containing protein, partial [Candidatus Methylacidiphilales bacterium]
MGGTTSQSITLLTGNYTGYAEVWCKLPESGDPTVITVTTGVVEPLTFTASIGRPAMSVLAHWSLNDGSTQILDSSAQLNHGTAVGAPGTGLTGTAQGDGLAIHLDGIGQYATVPHASSLSLGQRSFTLHGWFKAESTNTVSPLLFKGKTDSTGFHGYYLGLDATGALEFRLGTNGSSSGEVSFATQGTYDDGRWHQAIVVVDRLTKQIQLYVDGAARPVQLRSGSLGSISTAPGSHGTIVNVSAALTLDADTTEPLLIGADLTSGQNHFFAGGLDEFKIYTPDLVPLQLTAVTDSDSDGIADAWEMQIFGNLSNTPSLPSPWQAANIGTSLTGVSAYSSGVFTSYGMGLDIGGTQDSFRYVYQTFQGEGTVVGQVDGPANGGTSARAGLMLRASLDPAAANVSLLLIPGQGLVLQQRATTGGTTTQTVLEATATGPLWLKLERVGSSIKAYSSTDGLTWELLTTVPTPAGFPSQALAGFALTSNDETKIASATFTQGQFLATDTNNDGIGDGWALHYFGTIEIDPEALTPSGDGRTLLEVYQLGLDPTDFYQAVAPTVSIVSGNNQSGDAATFLQQPLKVLIANGQGTPLVNAPVTFTALSGRGALAETSGGATQVSLLLRTDADGYVQSWFQLPGSGGPCTIEVTAGTAEAVSFTATITSHAIEGMAGWWKFDETSGTSVEDASGNANNGATILSPSWVTGVIRNALQLSGSGQYITVPNSASLQIGASSFTISAWFKAPQYNLAAPILSKCKTDSTGFHGLYLGLDPSGSLEFRFGANVTTKDELAFCTDNTFTDNAWHQVIVSVDRTTQQAQIIVDGVVRTLRLEASSLGSISTASGSNGTVVSFAGATNLSAATTEPLLLGGDLTAGQHRYLSGPLDDVRFYNRTLTAQELALLSDSDADGLPDAWEMQQLGNLAGTASTATPSGDGLTLQQAYQQGINPKDFYHGIHPVLQIIGGNDQSGPSGIPLPQPLQVRVLSQSGQPLSNAPVKFQTTQGSGILSAPAARTNSQGVASTSLTPSGNLEEKVRVRASATNVLGTDLTFTSTIGTPTGNPTPTPGGGGPGPTTDPDVTPTGSGGGGTLPKPANLYISLPEPGSPKQNQILDQYGFGNCVEIVPGNQRRIKIHWEAAQSNYPVTYIIQRKEDEDSWDNVEIREGNANLTYEDNNLYSLVLYTYRIIALTEEEGTSESDIIQYRVPLIRACSIHCGDTWFTFADADNASYYQWVLNRWWRWEDSERPRADMKIKLLLNPSQQTQLLEWGKQTANSGLNVMEFSSFISVPTTSTESLEETVDLIWGVQNVSFYPVIMSYDASSWYTANPLQGPEEDLQTGLGIKYFDFAPDVRAKLNGKNFDIYQNGRIFALARYGLMVDTFQVDKSGDLNSFELTFLDGFPVPSNFTADDVSNHGLAIKVTPTELAEAGDTITIQLGCSFSFGEFESSDTIRYTYKGASGGRDFSLPIDESAGPKYRKVGLNGLPLSDEKPQGTEESDQEREETFVDALTLGVRHSTTDVYIPLPGSDFALSARRDFRSEIWTMRSGLRPHEMPDRPFGVCWSSNLAPTVHYTASTDPENREPDKVYVTDEAGAVHTFMTWMKNGEKVFFPMPTSRNEQQTPNLQSLTLDTTTTPATFTFKRKYGTTLIYEVTPLTLSIQNDRVKGSTARTIHSYARLVQATDRVGNVLEYNFDNTTNLVPKTIRMQGQTDIVLSIQQDSHGRITDLWDAKGNKTSFTYTDNIYSGSYGAKMLTSVTTPDGSVTQYTYNITLEPDLTPRPAGEPGAAPWHVDLVSITDPLQRTYTFSYDKLDGSGPAFDHSRKNYMYSPNVYVGYYPQVGMPRNVSRITLPDSTHSTFVNESDVRIAFIGQAPRLDGLRQTLVTDATGFQRRYRFEEAEIVALPEFKVQEAFRNRNDAKLLCYKTMVLDHGIPSTASYMGSETFKFDIGAAMALKEITDFSGNVTTFAHADAWTASVDYRAIMTNVAINGFYGDPTSQTNALGDTKTFTYFGESRIMNSVTDEEGRRTEYVVDSLGRRTKESVFPFGSATAIQVSEFEYGSTAFPGVMTKKTVKAQGGAGDPAWVQDMVVEFVLDANGRVAQEIVDPAGLAITTSHTYDANGAKLSTTDPRGGTTWFRYDSRNRLVSATFADGSSKTISYDARGNKVLERNENGIATLYQYDALNRLTAQVRDMNGDGVADSSDITTSFTHNAANAKLTVTSPTGGVSHMEYDALQRLIKTKDALDNETTFTYGANSGGTAFDSSGFKPTSTTDARGFTSQVVYDDLYRPVQSTSEYVVGGATAVSTTQYDKVGNTVLTTDPLNRQSSVTYDALNRPLVATNPDATTAQMFYTSTGLKWKAINELGRAAETEYDAAGRPVIAYGPLVSDGYGSTARPTTTTIYDAASNVIAAINPLGRRSDFVFDARNRKVQDLMPAVYDEASGQTSRPTATTQYDAAGRTIAVTDARGNTATTIYDNADRAVDSYAPAVPLPNGGMGQPHVHTSYDASGNVLSVVDPLGRTTSNTYDLLNRLLTTTDAANITVSYEYDAVGNRTKVIDGNNHATTYTYDGFKRNLTSTNPLLQVSTFVYNAVNKTQRIDAQGRVTDYTYDLRNRPASVVYGSTAAVNSARNFTYDDGGSLLSVTEPAKGAAATVSYTYDALNRAITETCGGVTHFYIYDLAGNRLQTIYGGTSRTIVSTYDALNRLTTMTEGGTRVTGYLYDLNGNILRKTLPNGDTETSGFDAANRAIYQNACTASSRALCLIQYAHDLAGNVVRIEEYYPGHLANRVVTNTYDLANRL